MRKRFFASCLLVAGVATLNLSGQTASLSIQVDHPTAKVSPMLYGLMTEEINYSYDGGLYGELVRDRTVRAGWGALEHWSLVARGDAEAKIEVDSKTGPSAALPRSIKLSVTKATERAPAGLQNDGYWGMAVRPETTYSGSFYAKSDASGLPVTVSLVNDQTGAVAGAATVKDVGGDWKRYTFTLKTGQTGATEKNHLVLTVPRPATVWLTLVSVFPPTYLGRPEGNRVDLMEKMAAMHPHFLRLPGGNYLEGDTIATRFNWKTTLHGTYDRLGHAQPWGYRSSDGLGLLEFLEWCEDLKMQPVLAVYAGYSLRRQVVPPGSRLRLFVQDALDEIEYATGGPDTRWGSERVADGHPAPFALTYVEVGNEDGYGNYDGRFAQFFDAIRAKYPALRVIATAPVTSRIPDVYDEHFYLSAAEMEAHAHHYDNRSRGGPKVLVGEWATVSGTPWKTDPARPPTPDLGAALADAAWMTGLERNSDLVVMAAYAPLLVNVNRGAWQWQTNLIGYDGLSSYGSPSYYAQAMFSLHHGDAVPRSSLEGADRFFESVTRDTRTGDIYVKAVNPGPAALRVRIEITGIKSIAAGGRQILLASAKPTDTNSISDPERIIPVESPLGALPACFERTFAPYSVTVLRLPAR